MNYLLNKLDAMFWSNGGVFLLFLILGLILYTTILKKMNIKTAKMPKIICIIIGFGGFFLSNVFLITNTWHVPNSTDYSNFWNNYFKSFIVVAGNFFMTDTGEPKYVENILVIIRYGILFLSVLTCSLAALSLQNSSNLKLIKNKFFVIMLGFLVGFTVLIKIPISLNVFEGYFSYIDYLIFGLTVLLACILYSHIGRKERKVT